MNNRASTWIIFLFLSVTWGSSFFLIKKSMYPVNEGELVVDPFQVGSLRIVIAGLVLLPIAYKYRKYLNRKNFWLLLITGVFGNLIPAMMFPLAETNVDGSLAGLLNMTTSFFVVLIGVFFYRSKPTIFQLLGLALGSTGLFLILNNQANPADTRDIRYAFFILPATLGYAISLTTIKFKLQHIPSSGITALSFLLILAPAVVLSFGLNAFASVSTHPDGWKALGYLSLLSVVGTAVAVLLFTRLIAISNHIFSSAIAYMLPIVAIFMGWLDGEQFHAANLIWVVVVLLGVYLMSIGKKQLDSMKQKEVGSAD